MSNIVERGESYIQSWFDWMVDDKQSYAYNKAIAAGADESEATAYAEASTNTGEGQMIQGAVDVASESTGGDSVPLTPDPKTLGDHIPDPIKNPAGEFEKFLNEHKAALVTIGIAGGVLLTLFTLAQFAPAIALFQRK